MKVLFLDRDGIINRERGDYTWKREDFVFTDHLFEFLKQFLERGFSIIVITNQGGIDKGFYSKVEVEQLHQWMKTEMEAAGIPLLDIFYCPHHNNIQKCLCRKPGGLLIEKSVAIYDVNPSESLMLGDRERDVEAAENAGIKGHLIDSNPDWRSIQLSDLI